jgi:hypothetical protein
MDVCVARAETTDPDDCFFETLLESAHDKAKYPGKKQHLLEKA